MYTEKYCILVIGYIGTGKTTLARNLSYLLGLRYLGTDRIREENTTFDFGEHSTESTYNELFFLLKEYLDNGENVVVDASFYKRKWREKLRRICYEYNIPIILIFCNAERSLKEKAVLNRYGKFYNGVSDYDVFLKIENEFEKLDRIDEVDFPNIISYYRGSKSFETRIEKSNDQESRLMKIILDHMVDTSVVWTPMNKSQLVNDIVYGDIHSARELLDGNIISTYLMGSAVTNELSYVQYNGSTLILSDYDLLFISKEPLKEKDKRGILDWISRLKILRNSSIIRTHIGFRCYTERTILDADIIYLANFLTLAMRIDGIEIRSHYPMIAADFTDLNGYDTWHFRLRVLLLKIIMLSKEKPSLPRDLKLVYSFIRAGLDLAFSSCCDHRIIPTSHKEAISILEYYEGENSKIYQTAKYCFDIKINKDNTILNPNFSKNAIELAYDIIDIGVSNWDMKATRIAGSIFLLLEFFKAKGISEFNGDALIKLLSDYYECNGTLEVKELQYKIYTISDKIKVNYLPEIFSSLFLNFR